MMTTVRATFTIIFRHPEVRAMKRVCARNGEPAKSAVADLAVKFRNPAIRISAGATARSSKHPSRRGFAAHLRMTVSSVVVP
jgi:enolase